VRRWLPLFSILLIATTGADAAVVFAHLERHVVPTADQASVQADFRFTNHGAAEVELLAATTSCGCASAMIEGLDGGKLHYAPGESGTITLALDLRGRAGRQSKTATLRVRDAADGSEQVHTLRLTADVSTAIDLSDSIVYWEVGEAATAKPVTITITQQEPVRVLGVDPVAGFAAEVVTVRDGREYRVLITPTQTSSRISASLLVRTDSRHQRYRRLDLFAMVTEVQR
jgi:hypothetical protein